MKHVLVKQWSVFALAVVGSVGLGLALVQVDAPETHSEPPVPYTIPTTTIPISETGKQTGALDMPNFGEIRTVEMGDGQSCVAFRAVGGGAALQCANGGAK